MSSAPWERRVERASRARGLLRELNRVGVIEVADVQVAQRVAWLAGQHSDEPVQLALALVVRALRLGSVCVRLDSLREDAEASLEHEPPDGLPWPEPGAWAAAIEASPLVSVGADASADRPLRLVDGRLYLQRSWEQQEDVRLALRARADAAPPLVDEERLRLDGDLLFQRSGLAPGEPDRQRQAAETAGRSWVTVLAGGPGTGKTTTIARLLALTAMQAGDGSAQSSDTGALMPRIALAAPSGNAAARLQQAVVDEAVRLPVHPWVADGLRRLRGQTVHRMLGAVPGRGVRRGADDPIDADIVVVDETSMVSIAQMAQLMAAVRPDARLVLVGDPDQLASVDAGAVLADITAAAEGGGTRLPHVRLTRTWRFQGAIDELAAAVRAGDADLALDVATRGDSAVALVALNDDGTLPAREQAALHDRVLGPARDAVMAAIDGDASEALRHMRRHRVLCAHRSGPHSKDEWNARIDLLLRHSLPAYQAGGRHYAGQPLLVTGNDPDLGVSNGDTGIVVQTDHGLRAALDLGETFTMLSPTLLDRVEKVHAMTVHKAQGSQFDEVTVMLPTVGSHLLTRELVYTAVTRARQQVTIVAHPDAFRLAVSRQALRASGLRERL